MRLRLTKLLMLAALLAAVPIAAAGCDSDSGSQGQDNVAQADAQDANENADEADDDAEADMNSNDPADADEEDSDADMSDDGADADVVTSGEIAYVTTDEGITGPSAILSGWTTVNFTNEGENMHHVQLFRLDDGKTLDDLGAAMATEGPPPAWLVAYGGPNIRMAPGPSTNVIDFAPGTYIATSVIPDAEGQSLLTKGAMSVLTVLDEDNGMSEPESDIQMVMGDFFYVPSEPFEAGAHVVRVESAGEQPHEVVLVKLEPEASIQEFAAAVAGEGPPGPPPGVILAGTTAMAPGQTAFMTADLEPGDYGLVCFVEDPESGEVHADLGMTMEFVVE